MISILIPAYGEAENLPRLVNYLKSVLAKDYNYEIIIINDENPDNSVEVIKDLEVKHREVKAIFNNVRKGKTQAIIDGLDKSQGENIVLMDADLQYLPSDIPRLLKALKDADVVNGRRVNRKDNIRRKIESKLYNLLIRLFFGVKFYDNNSGLKVFKRKVLEDITPILKPRWHRYLLVLSHKKGYRVIEKPIRHHKRERGKSKFTSPIKLLKGFIDLIRAYRLASRF